MQAVKLRYLNAMGIESWVPRSRSEAVHADAEATAADNHEQPVIEAVAEPAEAMVEMLTEEPVAAVRSLLDAEPGAASVPAPVAAPRRKSPAEPSVPRSPTRPQATPEFRLLVLHLAGSVLVVDESLLEPDALRSEQMHLLGDVLRSARLLVHGDATGSIEHQTFYWPQVEDATLDQGLPRAREALAYHVRSRLAGAGPLLHVTRGPETEATSGSAIARDSLAELAVTTLAVTPEVLDLQAPGRVRAQVWAELCTLAAEPLGIPS